MVIWGYIIILMLETYIAYREVDLAVMVRQYLLGTLQDHHVMKKIMKTQFHHHPEVAPHTMLELFEHQEPLMEVVDQTKKVEAQVRTIIHTEKTCTEIWYRLDSLT